MLQKMQDVFKILILTSETCTTVLHLIQCIYYKTLLFKALDNIISLRSMFHFCFRTEQANEQTDRRIVTAMAMNAGYSLLSSSLQALKCFFVLYQDVKTYRWM